MNSLIPRGNLSRYLVLLGIVCLVMLCIVMITFVAVRTTPLSPGKTQDLTPFAGFPTPTDTLEATVLPASTEVFSPTQAGAPPTVEPFPGATSLPPTGQAFQPPTDFLAEYFRLINARDYTATWARLSDRYKTGHNPDGYGPYVKFWDSVNQVDLVSPHLDYQNSERAKITVRLNLAYKNGVTGSQQVTFELIRDVHGASWSIDASY